MIKIVWSINDINKYQTGNLLDGAVKIETPQSVGELMKKAVPIAVILCVILFIAMLCKTIICKTVVISPIFILVGFAFGFLLLIIHEWLHGIVYPKEADVTIGRIKGKATFVALASYPLRRDRFILMCLIMNIRSGLPEYPLILNSLVRGVRIIKVIRFCIGFKLLNDAVGILEKDQQKRICWNRKEALNNQRPKHGIQRIFMISARGCIVVTAKRNRNNFIKFNVIFEQSKELRFVRFINILTIFKNIVQSELLSVGS